jgi:hypothetical protein
MADTSRSARVSQSLKRQRYCKYWLGTETTMGPLNTTPLSESYMLSEMISCPNKPTSLPNSLHTVNKSSRLIQELPAASSLLATASQVCALPLPLYHLPGHISAPSLQMTHHGPSSFIAMCCLLPPLWMPTMQPSILHGELRLRRVWITGAGSFRTSPLLCQGLTDQ